MKAFCCMLNPNGKICVNELQNNKRQNVYICSVLATLVFVNNKWNKGMNNEEYE